MRQRSSRNKNYPHIFLKIWNACLRIPEGKVATYSALARWAARPKAARVVALAMARNPFAPRVPCHRVIRSDGTLGGYSAPGGLPAKIRRLKREGVRFDQSGKIAPDCIIRG
ncbi:MAG: MGMT family protein [Elusimicrobia bacterium]|nr:MGMT family protein [Elusimicrobiota bacterium]